MVRIGQFLEWNGMELGLLGLSASLLAGRIQSNPPQDVDPSGPPGPGQPLGTIR